MKIIDELDLIHLPPGAVLGRHAVWLPPREDEDMGIKIPFEWGGRVQKYAHPREPSYPRSLVADEVALLRALAAHRWAPPTGDWIYVRTLISEHPGGWWADPCGAIGYEMADARGLAPGDFSVEVLRASGLVVGSPGAWGDLPKPGNIVNGHLVDVARSGFDRLRLADPPAGTEVTLPNLREDADALWADVLAAGAFPLRERPEPYQDVWFKGAWRRGERRVPERALALGFTPGPGESVLDIGCQLGGFLQFAALLHPDHGPLIGVDAQPEYVALARRLARAAGMNVCYREAPPTDPEGPEGLEALARWISALTGGRGVDHCLLLSMVKHLPGGEAGLWRLVDALRPGRTYLETNAVKPDTYPLRAEVERRGGRYVGDSQDRNLRRLYAVPGPARSGG